MSNKDMELREEVIRISGANPKKCMRCGKCSAACPAFNEMEYGPHKFADMVVNGRIEELMNSNSIYHCLSCFACVERCPRDVQPARLIEAVRVLQLRKSGNVHVTPNDIPCIADETIPQQAVVSAFRKFRK